jgi:hypothetical protein
MTHQSNPCANHRGERVRVVGGCVQRFCPFVIARRRFLELWDLSTKNGENLGGGLELGRRRMCENVLLRILLLLFEGSNKDGL